jgi:bifunctional enzyme CysN/CysC
MATGASTADLAIILIDARKGMLPQTKRHSFLVSLLGIRHVIVAVNKMDLVDYSHEVFERICEDYRSFAARLDVPDLRFVPVSALRGDNVARDSTSMPWYRGGSLLSLLETQYIGSDRNLTDFRFPVQWVNRPHLDFRGFSGTVASGVVRVGVEVIALPSRRRSRVKSIVSFDGSLTEAFPPHSVTMTLEDEIDLTRGDVLARPDNLPRVAREFDAMLVWMSEQPLVPGRAYWVKHLVRKTSAEVEAVRYRVDINTLHRMAASSLKLNEIGRCRIRTHEPLVFDSYRRNRQTGSFILVDRVTHETVAGGMIRDMDSVVSPDHWDGEIQSPKLQFSASPISLQRRAARFGAHPFTLLLTGLSGSGKTTLAHALESRLFEAGRAVTVLDGQNLRFGISRDLGFSVDERSENLRRAAEIAKLMNDAGLIVLAAFVAPQAALLARIREVIGADRLAIAHLSAPIPVCRARDTSGRYAAADRGEITHFPGVSASYEVPPESDIVLPTHEWTVEQCVEALLKMLDDRFAQTVTSAIAGCDACD